MSPDTNTRSNPSGSTEDVLVVNRRGRLEKQHNSNAAYTIK